MTKPSKKKFQALCELEENKDKIFIGRSSGGTEYIFFVDDEDLNVYYRTFSENTPTGDVHAVKFSKFNLSNPSLTQVEIGDKDSLDREDDVYNKGIIEAIKTIKTLRKEKQAKNKKGDENMDENKQGVVDVNEIPVVEGSSEQGLNEQQVVVPVVEEVKPVAQNAQVKPETQVNDVNFARQYGNYIKYLLGEAEYSEEFRKLPLEGRCNAAFQLFSQELQRVFPEAENLLTVENVRKNYNNNFQYNFIDENKQPVEMTEEQQNVVDMVNSHFENFHYEENLEKKVSSLADKFVALKLDAGLDKKGWEEEILDRVENGQLFVIDSQVPYSAAQKQGILNANRQLVNLQIENAVRGVEAEDQMGEIFRVYAESLAKLGGKKSEKTWLSDIYSAYNETGKNAVISSEKLNEEQKFIVKDLNRFISDVHYEENRDYEISALAQELTGNLHKELNKLGWEKTIRNAIDNDRRWDVTEKGTQNYVLKLNEKLISWKVEDVLRNGSVKDSRHDVIVRTLALEMNNKFNGKTIEEWRVEIENAYKENKEFKVEGVYNLVQNQVVAIVNNQLKVLHAEEEKENKQQVVLQEGGVKNSKKTFKPSKKNIIKMVAAFAVGAVVLIAGHFTANGIINAIDNLADGNRTDINNPNEPDSGSNNKDTSISNTEIASQLKDKFGEDLDLESVVTEVKDGKVTVFVKSEDGKHLYRVVGVDEGNDDKVTQEDVNNLLLSKNFDKSVKGSEFFTDEHAGEMDNADKVYIFVGEPDAEYKVDVTSFEYTANGIVITEGDCEVTASKWNSNKDNEQKAALVALGVSDYNGYRKGDSEKYIINDDTTVAGVAENGDKYLFVTNGEREL